MLSHSDYIEFLDSMTNSERKAWRDKTDNEREKAAKNGTLYDLAIKHNEEIMARKPKNSTQSIKLAEALTFVNVANRDTGEGAWQQHVRIHNKWAIKFDGVLTAGFPIEEDLDTCPHAERLLDAITKCGKTLALAQLESGALSVKGDKLRALVPCLDGENLPEAKPDPNIAAIDDRIKEAFDAVSGLVSEAATNVVEAAVLLQANSIIATDRKVMVEHWHGIDLPPALVLPKLFLTAVCKQSKKLTGFGFSENSVTFYYEDNSWIKTQRYMDEYPDVYPFLNVQSFPVDAPKDLFEAIDAVSSFHENERVYFSGDKVTSHESEEIGAQYEVKGLTGGKVFDAKLLRKVKQHIQKLDLTTYTDRAFFFGEKSRGVIMCIQSNNAE